MAKSRLTDLTQIFIDNIDRNLATDAEIAVLQEQIEALKDTAIVFIDPRSITRSKYQKREYFDREELDKLKTSIASDGILSPLVLRSGTTELIDGERRKIVSVELGLREVPVRYLDIDDRRARRLALAANQTRTDLTPIEETQGVLDLIRDELGLWDREDGERKTIEILSSCFQCNVALKTRQVEYSGITVDVEAIEGIIRANTKGNLSPESYRTRNLQLLKLPPELKVAINLNRLAYTKVLEIAKVKDDEQRQQFLDRVIEEDWSVREIQRRVKEINSPSPVAEEQSLLEEEEQQKALPSPESEEIPSNAFGTSQGANEEEEAPKPKPNLKPEEKTPTEEEEEEEAPKPKPNLKPKEKTPTEEGEQKEEKAISKQAESILDAIAPQSPEVPRNYPGECVQLLQFMLDAINNNNFEDKDIHLAHACLKQAVTFMGFNAEERFDSC
jgi:ParB family chromosome partitioning protein